MELVERMEEMIQGYEPDILLPEQYNELRRRRHELQGELKLMFAVLEDAIHCYLHHMNAKSRQRRILFYEVRDWMDSTRGKGLFAFETLCEALGIDAGRLRKMLDMRRRQIQNGTCIPSRQRHWLTRSRPRLRRAVAS
ncbi:MAG TPA: hypothetical protein VKB84_06025 [Candidatus Binataceae bacterium]|jgi:hypothetical protein|nr:hypothetical protein [Candidatus Binataceae bacterium]